MGTSRDTAMVLVDLFTNAQKSVLLAGYSFDHAASILSPLYDAIVERKVIASLFLEIAQSRHRDEIARDTAQSIERWLETNWPFGNPVPEIYYCPDTVAPNARMSLHAKCVVIDEEKTLVTSANFTDRGQTRNLEVGALIDDKTFAKRLIGQWFGLVSDKKMVRYV